MKLYSENEYYKLYEGNMLDMLDVIEPETIDSIVTDPPYELNFMNKGWDNAGVSFKKETWQKCYEVLKPGGYLLAFGGSRTFHRIACAIEDAGFEIRDTIMWLYGCLSEDTQVLTKRGFIYYNEIEENDEIRIYDIEKGIYKWEKPIRWNVYKVDKDTCYRIKSNSTDQLVSRNHRCLVERNGNLVFEFAENLNDMEKVPVLSHNISLLTRSKKNIKAKTYSTTMATITKQEYSGIIFCPTVSTGCFVARRNNKVFITGNSGFPKSMNVGLALDKKNGVESKIVGQQTVPDIRGDAFGTMNEKQGGSYKNITRDIKEAQNEWQGWGTALKPSFEPIIVARKPFKGSLVDNVIKYGVGGINIDECRVEPTGEDIGRNNHKNPYGNDRTWNVSKTPPQNTTGRYEGRFPANTILTYDETDFDEVCGGFPNTAPAKKHSGDGEKLDTRGMGWGFKRMPCNIEDNGGSASRYFYCAKASKKDRDEGLEEFENKPMYQADNEHGNLGAFYVKKAGGEIGDVQLRKNIHPTVKPTELMQYLVRLVTPNNGTVLDPFNGSGSTGKAVMYENVERNKNYKYIGIELTSQYLPIAKDRIEYALKQEKQLKLF